MTSRQATFSPRPSRCPSRNAGTAPDLRPRARQKAGASWLSRRAPEGKPHDPPAGCGASTDGLRPRPQGTQEGDAPEHPSPHSPNAQRPGQAWLVMDGNRASVFQHRDPASQDSTRAGCATLPMLVSHENRPLSMLISRETRLPAYHAKRAKIAKRTRRNRISESLFFSMPSLAPFAFLA
jgi:hypothetical protein